MVSDGADQLSAAVRLGNAGKTRYSWTDFAQVFSLGRRLYTKTRPVERVLIIHYGLWLYHKMNFTLALRVPLDTLLRSLPKAFPPMHQD